MIIWVPICKKSDGVNYWSSAEGYIQQGATHTEKGGIPKNPAEQSCDQCTWGTPDDSLSRAMKFQVHGDLLGRNNDLTDNIQLEEELEMQVLINALTESYWNMYL